MGYILHLTIASLIFVALSLAANLVVGLCGRLVMCSGLFASVGAYIFATLTMNFSVMTISAVGIAGILGSLAGWSLGKLLLPLREDRFVLATIAAQVIAYWLLHNLSDQTGGAYGIPGIPRIWAPEGLSRQSTFLLLTAIVTGSIFLIHQAIRNSPFGRVARAVRDDQVLAQSLGKDPVKIQCALFAVFAGLTAIVGAVYGSYLGYISPTTFALQDSVLIVAAVLLGGADTTRGPILGAVFLVLLPELLRFAGLPTDSGPPLREIIFGALLILVARRRLQKYWAGGDR